MVTQLKLGDIAVDVVLKDIKNVHLSVYPPTGRVRISAPERTSLDTIRVFAISKLGWIKQQQQKLREQKRETPREFLDRESHYVWGKRYLSRWLRETIRLKWNSNTAICSSGFAAERMRVRNKPLLLNGIVSSSRKPSRH